MAHKYSMKNYDKEHMAKALGIALPISLKQSVEVCSFIRNKNVDDAKKILEEVLKKKKEVPFKRFHSDRGHKTAGPGAYPQKASKQILSLIEAAEANAQFKGLNTSDLVISHICAHKSGRVMRFGRKRGRSTKRTSIEIFVSETKKTPKEKKTEQKKPVAEEKEKKK